MADNYMPVKSMNKSQNPHNTSRIKSISCQTDFHLPYYLGLIQILIGEFTYAVESFSAVCEQHLVLLKTLMRHHIANGHTC